jgi:kynurenine formamidase
MKLFVEFDNTMYEVDSARRADLFIPVRFGAPDASVSAFGIESAAKQPYAVGTFRLSVEQGAGCNCEVLTITPHGQGTHTECVGHISRTPVAVAEVVRETLLVALLVTLEPEYSDGDRRLTPTAVEAALSGYHGLLPSAIVVRTVLPDVDRRAYHWGGTNPPYFMPEALALLAAKGFEHLVVDLPSVDPEVDGGALTAHHAWWDGDSRRGASITELVVIPEALADGLYFLDLAFGAIESDASPSKPVLYPLVPMSS